MQTRFQRMKIEGFTLVVLHLYSEVTNAKKCFLSRSRKENVAKAYLRMLPISIRLSSCMSPYNILSITEPNFVLFYFA